MDRQCNDCVGCTQQSILFKYLRQEELEWINKCRTTVFYQPGEIIVKQGAPVTHVISFADGLAKVYLESPAHKRLILRFLAPTQFVGGPGLYVDQIHHFSVQAIEVSQVCFIDFTVFKKIVRQNSDFADAFIRYISKEGIFDYDRFVSLTQKHMAGRLADALLYLQKNVYQKHPEGIRLMRNELAEFSGMSADSVMRILKEMVNDELIALNAKRIRVLNLKRLERISQIG